MTTIAPLPPTRFLPRVEEELRWLLSNQHQWRPAAYHAGDSPEQSYRFLLERLTDPFTKRILFSARQAGMLDGIGQPPPEIQGKLHLPFEQFYLELDDDLELTGTHDAQGNPCLLRAMTVEQVPSLALDGHAGHIIAQIVYLYRSTIPGSGIEFFVDLTCGTGYTEVGACRYDPTTGVEIAPDVPDHHIIAAPRDAPDGALMHVARNTALLSYLLAYLNAKSITIEAEPVPRGERRWHERHGTLPRPWHVVKVDPKIVQPGVTNEHDPGTRHAFRYDVIGHLRFGRHKRADGTYSHTAEWVPAHQRGLANVDYIPKTYKVERGKRIHPLMRQYYGSTLLTEGAE